VKVAVVEIMVIRHMVVLVEKVVAKERPQTLVVEEIMVLVLVVMRALQYVKRVELILH
jgi:hypothetical protein